MFILGILTTKKNMIMTKNKEKEMFKVLAINCHGQNETLQLPIVPRIGDTIPVFYQPWPKVNGVVLKPEKAFPELVNENFDAVITVS